MEEGLKDDIPMDAYLRLNAFGSAHLDWLAVSPMRYRHNLEHPPEESDGMALGTAVHTMVLEPEKFDQVYVPEPLDAAPDAKSPRATNAYKDAVKEIERSGKRVIKMSDVLAVQSMAASIANHEHARRALVKAPRREVTMVWRRGDRLCRGRADALGPGLLVDLKITKDLRGFSPWVITRLGYYRQQAWYRDGLARLGNPIEIAIIVAVERFAPHDVGVFALDGSALEVGRVEIEHLMGVLDLCEKSRTWPGMFSDVQPGYVTEALSNSYLEEADGEES